MFFNIEFFGGLENQIPHPIMGYNTEENGRKRFPYGTFMKCDKCGKTYNVFYHDDTDCPKCKLRSK